MAKGRSIKTFVSSPCERGIEPPGSISHEVSELIKSLSYGTKRLNSELTRVSIIPIFRLINPIYRINAYFFKILSNMPPPILHNSDFL